jgi:putative endonuclease
MDSAGIVRYKKGKDGEEHAAGVLKTAGMEIIARNFRAKLHGGTSLGEIDIIAFDPQIQTIVFVEVKTWSFYGLEDLQYGINIRKQRKIIETAKHFMFKNRKYSKMAIRFDVVFISKAPSGYQITHLASAFTERV